MLSDEFDPGVGGCATIDRPVPDDGPPTANAELGWPDPWLRLVGEFAVCHRGLFMTATAIGSRKARTLLALLAVHRGEQVPLDRVVEVLWEGTPPKQPAENVATLVSRLRSAFGRAVISGGRGGYRIGEHTGDDLHDAAGLVAVAEARLAGGEAAAAHATARHALDLLGRGEVLADEAGSSWADEVRGWHGRLRRRARHTAAEAALRAGDVGAAGAVAEATLTADPLDEVAARALMRVHATAGEPARALMVYERLRATLARELGVDPAPATQDLHVEILRANAAHADPPPARAVPRAAGARAVGRPGDAGMADLLGNGSSETDLLASLAVLTTNELRFSDAVRYGRQAVAVARASGDERRLATALAGLRSTYAYLGELTELRRVLSDLEPLVPRLDDPWLTQWTVFESGFPMIASGDWDGAVARLLAALHLDQHGGGGGYESWYVAHLGWLARLAGRHEEAITYGRAALRTESEASWSAAVPALLSVALLATGQPDHRAEAVALLERSLSAGDRRRTASYRLRCLAPLAEATGSIALLDEVDALVRDIDAPPGSAWLYGADAYTATARAWLSRNEPHRAAEVLSPLLAAGARTGWHAPLAEARRIVAGCHGALSRT